MENDTRRAMRSIEAIQRQMGKRNSRIHKESADDNINRIRALEGIFGECNHLHVEFFHRQGHERVSMRCDIGLSPLEIYRRAPFGKEANCEKFEAK